MDFLRIPNTVPPKALESFVIHENVIHVSYVNRSQIVTCNRLGTSERTTVKFLNRKDTENILTNKKKFRDIDISEIVTDGTEARSD